MLLQWADGLLNQQCHRQIVCNAITLQRKNASPPGVWSRLRALHQQLQSAPLFVFF